MSTKQPADIVAGPQSIGLAETDSGEITEQTAAELRALCDKTGEPFDGNLTEAQAQKRIAALREVHELD
ncbi:DUF3072 domain-containing protein [uncultured Roseobacter sp.]|uniref:DUF3072 domain-containing protein n=1 Tax=uncultured Roseobacter sp. TaxID=114847 RepID=UPI002618E277|nr:DUF3072 domain-containing protein [uncultured Roseobacter sp.]